jgi:hypothetical protein
MCTVPLPLGVYPIAVDKYINIHLQASARKRDPRFEIINLKTENVL